MNSILLFIVEHPRDAFVVLASMAVAYLLNALKKHLEADLAEMKTSLSKNTEEVTKLRIAFIRIAQESENFDDVISIRGEIRETRDRLQRLEATLHGI